MAFHSPRALSALTFLALAAFCSPRLEAQTIGLGDPLGVVNPCTSYPIELILHNVSGQATVTVTVVLGRDQGVPLGEQYMEVDSAIAPTVSSGTVDHNGHVFTIEPMGASTDTLRFNVRMNCTYDFDNNFSVSDWFVSTYTLTAGALTDVEVEQFKFMGARLSLDTPDGAFDNDSLAFGQDELIREFVLRYDTLTTEPPDQRIVFQDDHRNDTSQPYIATELRFMIGGIPRTVFREPSSPLGPNVFDFIISYADTATRPIYEAIIAAPIGGVHAEEVLDISELCFVAGSSLRSTSGFVRLGWSCSYDTSGELCSANEHPTKLTVTAPPHILSRGVIFENGLTTPDACFYAAPSMRRMSWTVKYDDETGPEVKIRLLMIRPSNGQESNTDLPISVATPFTIKVNNVQVLTRTAMVSDPSLSVQQEGSLGCHDTAMVGGFRTWVGNPWLDALPPLHPGDSITFSVPTSSCLPQITSDGLTTVGANMALYPFEFVVIYDYDSTCNDLTLQQITGPAETLPLHHSVGGATGYAGTTTPVLTVPNADGKIITNMVTQCFDQAQPYDLAFQFANKVTLLPYNTATGERIGIFIDLERGLFMREDDLTDVIAVDGLTHPMELELANGAICSSLSGTPDPLKITVFNMCQPLDCPDGANDHWKARQRLLLLLPDTVLPNGTSRIMDLIKGATLHFPVRMHCPGDAADTSCTDYYIQGCPTSPDSVGDIPTANLKVTLVHFPNGVEPCQDTVLCTGAHVPLGTHEQVYNLQCPGCTRLGIHSKNYDVYRTSYGFVDADDDGFADKVNGAMQRLTLDDVKNDSLYARGVKGSAVMYGDSLQGELETFMEMNCSGYGPCDGSGPLVALRYLYYETTVGKPATPPASIPQLATCTTLLKPIGLDLTMSFQGDSTIVSISDSVLLAQIESDTIIGTGQTVFRYDLTPSVIAQLDSTVFIRDSLHWRTTPAFNFNNYDAAVIKVVPKFRVVCNIGLQFQQVYVENLIYLGDRAETPTTPLQDYSLNYDTDTVCAYIATQYPTYDCGDVQYWCTRKTGTFTLLGYWLERNAGEVRETCGAGPNYTYGFSMGANAGDTYAGDNFFAHEYRNWFKLDSVNSGIVGSQQAHWTHEHARISEITHAMAQRTFDLPADTSLDPPPLVTNMLRLNEVPYFSDGLKYDSVSEINKKLLLPDDDFLLQVMFVRSPLMITPDGTQGPPGFTRYAHPVDNWFHSKVPFTKDALSAPGGCAGTGMGGCSNAVYVQPDLQFASSGAVLQAGALTEDSLRIEVTVKPHSSVNSLANTRIGNAWVAFGEPAPAASENMDVRRVEYRLKGATNWSTATTDALEGKKYLLTQLPSLGGNQVVQMRIWLRYDCNRRDTVDLYTGWECGGPQVDTLILPPLPGTYCSTKKLVMVPLSRDLLIADTAAVLSNDTITMQVDLQSTGQGDISALDLGFVDAPSGWRYVPGTAQLFARNSGNWVVLGSVGQELPEMDHGLCPSDDEPFALDSCYSWRVEPALFNGTVPPLIQHGLCGAGGNCQDGSWLRFSARFVPSGCQANCTTLHAWATAVGCDDLLRTVDVEVPAFENTVTLHVASVPTITDCATADTLEFTVVNTGLSIASATGLVLSVTLPSNWAASAPTPGWAQVPQSDPEQWQFVLPQLVPQQAFVAQLPFITDCEGGQYPITATVNVAASAGCALCEAFEVEETDTVIVDGDNTPPVAVDDNGGTLANNGVDGIVAILNNDTDADGDPVAPTNGSGQFTVDLDPNTAGIQTSFTDATGMWVYDTSTGEVAFDPANNYDGTAVITYELCDPDAACDTATITFVVEEGVPCPIIASLSSNYSCGPVEDHDCAVLPIQGDEPIDAQSNSVFPAFTADIGTGPDDFIFQNGWGIFTEYEPGRWQLMGGLNGMSDPQHVCWVGLYLSGPYTAAQWALLPNTTVTPGMYGDPNDWQFFTLDTLMTSRVLDNSTGAIIEYPISQGTSIGIQMGEGASTHNDHEGLYADLVINGDPCAFAVELDCLRDLPNADCTGTITVVVTATPGPVTITLVDDEELVQGFTTLQQADTVDFDGLCAGMFDVLIAPVGGTACYSDSVNVEEAELFTFTVDYAAVVCGHNEGSATIEFPPGTPHLNDLGITWYWTDDNGDSFDTTGVPNVELANIATDQEAWFVVHDPVTGCRRSHKIFIHAAESELEFYPSAEPLDCPDPMSGVLHTNEVSGAYNGIYTMVWTLNGDTVGTEESVHDVGAGTYVVTFTDAAGCQRIDSVTIEPCSGCLVGVEFGSPQCPNEGDGWIRLTLDHEDGYTVTWTAGSDVEEAESGEATLGESGGGHEGGHPDDLSGPFIEGLTADIYTYTITVDATGEICATGDVLLESVAPFEVRIIWPGMDEDPEGGPDCVENVCAAICFGPWPDLTTEELLDLIEQGWPDDPLPEGYSRDDLGIQWSVEGTDVCLASVCEDEVSVTVTGLHRCTASATAHLHGEGDRALGAAAEATDFTTYPVPNDGTLVNLLIQGLPDTPRTVQLRMRDVLGREVFTKELQVEQRRSVTTFSLGNRVVPGIYHLFLEYDGSIITHPLMIQR